MQWVRLKQVVLQRGETDVVQVGLARLGVGLQGLDDRFLALVERLLAGFADIQSDEDLIAASEGLEGGVLQSGLIQIVANRIPD